MDDDDSPDELIRRGVHKKRTAPWNISDSDDDIDASEDGESESSDEDDSDDNNDEDDDLEGEVDNEKEDGEDEEQDAKAGDGVLGEPSTTISTMSSDEDADTCPICLNTFSNQPVATPENCEHYFCLDCILAWSKNANSCPVDRITFNSIYLRKSYGGKVQKMITVQKIVKEDEVETVDLDLEQTNCEVCHGSDREDRLLLCDGCDAGYHMECLTPPLDTVPVEEWFCPECVANNNSGSAEEQNQTQRFPSTAQPTTSRSQSRAAGPIRAIARTQHSERVRANVNRHRITQARTSQLAPTDQIQSNWLDETINAVVAGLNTAIYVRDLTPCAPTRRRRKTGTRRKATKKKPLSVKGKKGHSTKARRKRKGRRTTTKKTRVGKKVATPRSRIANSLGLSKDKNNFSLPTVCRPSEHTLSNMRADIGAASLSIYGDPFDLDPFVDRSEEDDQEETVSSLLEAKRRGISHSAFRSHQPVARPVSMGLSRHGMDIPQTGGGVEAAPVPDLLGSILSGQSLLLMDSSDVIISREGYLQASQAAASSSTLKPGLRERSSSEESRGFAQPVVSASLGESSSSRHLPGSSHNNLNRPLSKCFSPVPSDVSHIQPPYNPNLSSRGHKCFQPPLKNQPSSSFGVQATNGASTCAVPSSCRVSDPRSNSKAALPLPRQPIKAPTKPVWVDVDVLPRIPKIKRDTTNSSTNKSNSNSSSSMNTSGMPETALVSFAGDQNRQQDVAQQSNPERQPQNQGAGSSSAFANSFSLSSSTASPSASLYNPAVSSSSSSSISFRINISRNSWHSRRVILPSSSASGSSTQAEREKTDEAKKKQEHRDKQKLMASHTASSNKKDENVYDPFNPTVSDASSSDSEGESLASSFHGFNTVPRPAFSRDVAQSKQKLLQVKTETPESEVAPEDPRSAHLQTCSRVGSCASRVVKVEKESVLVKAENQTAFSGIEVKRQTGPADSGKDNIFGHYVKSRCGSETPVTFSPHSLDHLKIEEESGQKVITSKNVLQNKVDSSGSGSCLMKVKLKERIKPDPRAPEKKTSTTTLQYQQQQSTSSILASYRDKTKDHLVSKQGDQLKKMDKGRERRSRSRERRTHSMSESSQSSSPKTTVKKRRRRSRSGSSSSTAEHSSRKKYKESSQESSNSGHEKRSASNDKTRRLRSRSRSGGRTKDHRRGRSRSKSPPKSPYRSRSKERRKEHTHSCHEDVKARPKDKRRPRSRSRSRERRKVDSSSENLTKSSVSCFSSSKYDKYPKESSVPLSSGKEGTIPEVKKDVSKCTFVAKVKKEDDNADIVAISKGIKKEINIVKEVKKDQQEFIDMFQRSPIPPHSEKEERPSTMQEIKKELAKIEVCKTMKTEETCEITRIKPEPVSAELPVTSPHTSVGQEESPKHFQPNGKGLANQASAIELKDPTKQAPESDEGISVDMLLHSLDCVKQEHTEGFGAKVKQEDIKQEGKTEAQQLPTASKNKIQGKRVTWNIQVPDGAQPDKCASKRALYKRKLKQEATHRPPSMSTSQETSGPGSVSDSSKRDDGTLPTASGCQAYLKKLHMQERAIEEVKLAIKPFYQKRDINKEEYKAILRKAVQKVCHSKSGEINPVKVGNLVKAYVDKYKHARKHQKSETKPAKTS